MKRLPAAKKNQLIGVIAATVALICVVYFTLIGPQNSKNHSLAQDIAKETTKLAQYKTAIKEMPSITSDLNDKTQKLAQAEQDVASGDLYAWTYDTMRRFKAPYHVDIPTIGQPSQGDCDLIANFPYRQISFSLSGTAYYHDLGKFISDFENQFPHCRVLDLSADPMATVSGAVSEKLNFRVEIVALVKPNS